MKRIGSTANLEAKSKTEPPLTGVGIFVPF